MVMGPVLGPTIGGLILDNFGWRWLFYVNVPIGVVAVLSGMRKLPTDAIEDAGRLDLWGLALIATGLVAVTYGLAEIGLSTGDHLSHVVVPLVLGVCLVAGFVHRALRVEQPLLDVRLYLNRAFTAASVTIFCIGAALFGGMILMPLYFQTVRHEDAVYTGLLLIPRGFGAALATWMAARVMDRIGAGASSALGILIGVGFTVPLVVIGSHTSYVLICLVMALSGFGLGLATTPAMTAAYRALRPSQIHDASPQLNIVLRVGGSVGTGILTVVLQQHLTKAGSSLSAQAHAFGSTFWWVVGVIGVAVIPTVMLMWVERPWTSWARSDVEGEPAVATVQMLEAE
jgi:EmrB/QacA subfamily drug resistance transporter